MHSRFFQLFVVRRDAAVEGKLDDICIRATLAFLYFKLNIHSSNCKFVIHSKTYF
jgi:hypothetical protein